jgi:arabinosyltransferase C
MGHVDVHLSTLRGWPAALVGLCGLTLALLLPFAPVFADETTVSWPRSGQPATSTTATLVPYRPAALTVHLPCLALRETTTVLATAGEDADGLIVRAGPDGARLVLGDRAVPLEPGCGTLITAGPRGVAITAPDGMVTVVSDVAVPKVFGFRTDLAPEQSAGLAVTATVVTPFGTSPTPAKLILVGLHLAAVALALALLPRARRRFTRPRWRPASWVDVGVVAALGVWAVIGPLAVDDGWASVIARNIATTGDPGNYYRWWNAAEVPFSATQQLLAPLTALNLTPLWLRLPSTLLAVATWFVLTRGVLRAALPRTSSTAGVRVMAALLLLTTWLPFNLGTRPESYVAFGVTAVLALLWRCRSPSGVGWAALAAGLTLTVSPTGVVVLAPFLVFAPRIASILRRYPPRERMLCLLLCAAVASTCLTVIFADQTWAALLTATDWHTYFGPSLPWWQELDRYGYLLSDEQQGSFAKRLPVLLVLALVVVVAGRRKRSAALQLAVLVLACLALLALSPSKWSYHLGALAGVFAAFLVVALLDNRVSGPRRRVMGILLVAGAVVLSFDGPNTWWLPALYDVPWPENSWAIGIVVVVVALVFSRRRGWPAMLTLTAAGTAVAVLFASFAAAPVRRPEGSLALMNLHRLTGGPVCGLADAIEVLPDGAVLAPAGGTAELAGFVTDAGFVPAAPPPDRPGAGASTFLWGSHTPSPENTGTLVSQWFSLPGLRNDEGVAVSVSGRTTDGNTLVFEFGDGTRLLGDASMTDRVAPDEDPAHPLWRSIGVDAAQIPQGATRVRLRANDTRTDTEGWLAVTGPRLRTAISLERYLAGRQPILIGWPVAFLFPCLRDIPRVSDGLAQTPTALIEGPRPRTQEERDPVVGGTFAQLDQFGGVGEIPTRLAGAPDVDWGALLISRDDAVRDDYDREVRRMVRSGWDSTGHVRPER